MNTVTLYIVYSATDLVSGTFSETEKRYTLVDGPKRMANVIPKDQLADYGYALTAKEACCLFYEEEKLETQRMRQNLAGAKEREEAARLLLEAHS